MEREAECKSEYLDGHIYAMGEAGVDGERVYTLAGVGIRHNTISANVARLVGNSFVGRPCRVFSSDMRVQVQDRGVFHTYPDVVAVCGTPVLADTKMDTLTNPTVLFEVLSPPTEGYDRGRKFELYRRLESLQEYVLVAQDRAFVEHYVRSGSKWELSDISGLDDALRLESIQCELALRDIYDKVEFPAVAAEPIGDRTGAEGEELQR
jgi:Uma2 family endonuclease